MESSSISALSDQLHHSNSSHSLVTMSVNSFAQLVIREVDLTAEPKIPKYRLGSSDTCCIIELD